MKLLKFPLAALLLTALVLAGCGGGDDEPTTTAKPTTESEPSLTKADLISQGDAICAEVNAAIGSPGAGDTEEGGEAAQAAGLYGGMVESLKRLGEPQEPEGYADFIASADALADAED